MIFIIKYNNISISYFIFFVFLILLHRVKRMMIQEILRRILNAMSYDLRLLSMYCGRWLNTLIPDTYGLLLYFVKFVNAG
jgi:hypothetical protein